MCVVHVVQVLCLAQDECGAWMRGVGEVCEMCMCLDRGVVGG